MDICYYKGNGEFSFQLKCRHLTLMTIADEFCLGRIAEVLECSPNVETLIINFTNPGRSYQLTPTNTDTFQDILRFPRGSKAAQVMVKYPLKGGLSSAGLN
ncbi:hypothetical protein MLD38_036962 [Melastoma candidum]|uniref:Uncharacterized protein n=1 Tax=Melastoma candidum TaxID=119954 RepID=A0ACB9LN48_9MYRT|nr:hypothetical protein MLD38_036962 [Melastoma candidum]